MEEWRVLLEEVVKMEQDKHLHQKDNPDRYLLENKMGVTKLQERLKEHGPTANCQ
jgi:hypothetical protein